MSYMLGGRRMNIKQIKASILYHAYLDYSRENADYEFTDSEQAKFDRAYGEVQQKLFDLAMTHFDEEVYEKIYGI